MAQPDAGAEGAESEFRVAEGIDGVGGAAGVFDACVHMASKEVLKPVIVCATRSSRCPTRSSRRVPRVVRCRQQGAERSQNRRNTRGRAPEGVVVTA